MTDIKVALPRTYSEDVIKIRSKRRLSEFGVKKVVVCGGGNSVHVMTADFGQRKDIDLFICAPYKDEAKRLSEGMKKKNGVEKLYRGGSVVGAPTCVTAEFKTAITDADLIIIPLPAFAHYSTLEGMCPYLKKGAIIASFPGQGGFELTAKYVLKEKADDIILVGFNQLPYQCRTEEFGTTVQLIGHKEVLRMATIPSQESHRMKELFEELLGYIEIHNVGHQLNITLHPANQVIHPCIMYGIFHGNEGEWNEPPMFYANVNDETAALLDAVSDEILLMAKVIHERTGLDMGGVPHISDMMREMYRGEIADDSCTKTIFQTNKGYEGLRAPMVKLDSGKYRPDWSYRYMTDDIPLGLCILRGISDLLDVDTPNIDKIIMWAQKLMGKEYIVDHHLRGKDIENTASPQRYGFTFEQIL